METQAAHPPLLGEYSYHLDTFPGQEEIIASFQTDAFRALKPRRRYRLVNEALIDLIRRAPHESFLFPAAIDFIDKVNHAHVLNETWTFTLFEFWMNTFSGLSEADNYTIRAKIAGKYIPRDDYQAFFPIGMGKVFDGTHFVVAHLSPDVDTMIASFFGWLDAFAARVGSAQHVWSLPGGPPESPVTSSFRNYFGHNVFSITARQAATLTLSAIDLVTQKNLIKETAATSISTIDHGSNDKAVILIDENGHFQGDWHTSDVELVRQIIILFKSCLRWFENSLHGKLISLFARPSLTIQDIPPFLGSLFDVKISACEPAEEFTAKQKEDLNAFFQAVIRLPKGLESTFSELNQALHELGVPELARLQAEVERLVDPALFDREGKLIEDRPRIFNRIEKVITELDRAILHARNYAERLGVALKIKKKVLRHPPVYVPLRSDVEDIRLKIKTHDYISVAVPEEVDKLFPIGIVWASDLRKASLGTVSFRDFCNLDEVKMASYLSVISVVDHHKSSLKTGSPPMALIGDTQSCNVIVAEQTFLINDRYSLGGGPSKEATLSLPASPAEASLLRRKIQRTMAAKTRGPYYIHPKRELVEYFCFLYAILDDTDLLTKVSARDVECVAELLNRMKSLASGQETEIITLDPIPRNGQFAKTAAKEILHNPDMHSIYKTIYSHREKECETSLQKCAQGLVTNIFSDTKEQNGCCRIGQLKLFSSNIPTYHALREGIVKQWLKEASQRSKEHPEIDLHLFMISTIPNAEEVYANTLGQYSHEDELWIWVSSSQQGLTHLASFLSAFQNASEVIHNHLRLSLIGKNVQELDEVFTHNFLPVERKEDSFTLENEAMAVLYYDAGSINSRKSMISPYLPRLIS